ncbi:MAG: tyrosine-type recombinase/integrase [Acidimicrobiales bacterium]
MARRRIDWGSIRKLPPGRYQARYRVDGIEQNAPGTFQTRSAAADYLAQVRTDLGRGAWIDPLAGQVPLADFAWRWLEERPNLRPRTRELYVSELKRHILPALGAIEVGSLTTSRVRTWHAAMLNAGRPGAPTVAKCYRLLRAILGTAVEDGLLAKNPCTIKGAGVERHPERSVATIEQVFQLAEVIDPRFRMMVLLASFTGLRLGELQALTPRSVDLAAGTVTVTRQLHELGRGGHYDGPPKSEAGYRTVAIPPAVLPRLAHQIEVVAAEGPEAFLFGGAQGKPLRRATFYTAWHAAVEKVGLPPGFRFHDLRHTGNTLAAATGASTKELMVRLGHSLPRAALIYQHASRERDAAIAAALSEAIVRSVGPVSEAS